MYTNTVYSVYTVVKASLKWYKKLLHRDVFLNIILLDSVLGIG